MRQNNAKTKCDPFFLNKSIALVDMSGKCQPNSQKYTKDSGKGFNTPDLLNSVFFMHCEKSIAQHLVTLHTFDVKNGFRDAILEFGQGLSLATSHACADVIPTCRLKNQ